MKSNKTYKLLKEQFSSKKEEIYTLPKVIEIAKQLLPKDEIPDKMAIGITLFELGLFVSHFNNKIRLNSKTLVTTNLYMFMWMPSGFGKDRSVRTINKALEEGYKKLYTNSYNRLLKAAKDKASKQKGNVKYYKEFFTKPKRLGKEDVNSTPEGMLYSMNLLEKQGNAYCVTTSELGNELQSSKNNTLLSTIKQLVLGFDLGYITAKSLRDDERQLKDVKNLNISSLMFSSVHTLIKNPNVRDRFINEMMAGLARRSFMVFIEKVPDIKEFNSIKEFDEYYLRNHIQKEHINKKLGSYSSKLVDKIPTNSEIKLSKEARIWHNRYLIYCKFLAKEDKFRRYKMTQLSLEHRAWLALKISGIIAMLSGRMIIEENDYFQAIGLGLKFIPDINAFQNEVEKEPYERFIDYCREFNHKGKLILSKHKLLKEGFLLKTELTEPKMKALCDLSTEADELGVYDYRKKDGGTIKYTKLKDTTIKPTRKPVKAKTTGKVSDTISTDEYKHKFAVKEFRTSDKETRLNKCAKGFENKEYLFKDIGKELLCKSTSFNEYWFTDGIKGNDTIQISSTKTFTLDVDKSILDIYQMHDTLKEYKHHIATTSDSTNLHKYRIVFELDREIDLTPRQWKKFYKSVGNMMNIKVDTNISKAGSYLGYKDSLLLSSVNGMLLETKAHLIEAYKEDEPTIKVKKIKGTKELDKAWENRYNLFKYAYNAPMGTGGLLPYVAMHKALEMGFPPDYVKELVLDINYAWELPMKRKDLNSTLIIPILGEEFVA